MLPEVDFFILETKNRQDLWRFACGEIEKYYTTNQKLFILFDDDKEAAEFDQLLWTFKDISFLPHTLHKNDLSLNAPIVLGSTVDLNLKIDVLVNLRMLAEGLHPPICAKIIDFVFEDVNVKQSSRKRYSNYRDAGYKINNYK